MTEERIQKTAKQVYESWKERGLYLINVEYLIRALVAKAREEGRKVGIEEMLHALRRYTDDTGSVGWGDAKREAERLKEQP